MQNWIKKVWKRSCCEWIYLLQIALFSFWRIFLHWRKFHFSKTYEAINFPFWNFTIYKKVAYLRINPMAYIHFLLFLAWNCCRMFWSVHRHAIHLKRNGFRNCSRHLLSPFTHLHPFQPPPPLFNPFRGFLCPSLYSDPHWILFFLVILQSTHKNAVILYFRSCSCVLLCYSFFNDNMSSNSEKRWPLIWSVWQPVFVKRDLGVSTWLISREM